MRRNPRELLGISQCAGDISRVAGEGNERRQDIAIVRMPNHRLLQRIHSFMAMAGGVQCHRVDVGVSRAIGLELGRTSKLGHRGVRLFEAREHQPQCVIKP